MTGTFSGKMNSKGPPKFVVAIDVESFFDRCKFVELNFIRFATKLIFKFRSIALRLKYYKNKKNSKIAL